MVSSQNENQLEDSWKFLDNVDKGKLSGLTYTMLEDRVSTDKRSFLNVLDDGLSISCQFPNSRAFSLACIEMASELNIDGDFKEAIVLSVYSSIYNQSCDSEWIWDIKPLSCSRHYNCEVDAMQYKLEEQCTGLNNG